MKNKNESNRGTRPPILSVSALIAIAACVYFSVDMIIRNVRADIENEATGAILPKLSSVNIITAIGLAALVIVFVCIQFGNYFAFVKPLRKARIDAENLSIAGRDEYSRIETLRISLAESRDFAERFLYKLDDASTTFLDIGDGVTHITSSARQLFANVAAIDNSAAKLTNAVDAGYKDVQTAPTDTLAGFVGAPPGQGGTPVGQVGTPAGQVGTPAVKGDVSAWRTETRVWRESAQVVCSDALTRYFDTADNLLNMLNRQREHINGKFTSFEHMLKESSAQADTLSLDAAIESARAGGEAGHGFAHIADSIRAHAESMRGILPIIHETSERLDMQAELSEEYTSLFAETRMNFSKTSPSVYENAGYAAENDIERTRIRGEFDSLRVAIRSVGASLSELRDAAASEMKRADRISEKNTELTEDVKALITQLNGVDSQIAMITDTSIFMERR